MRRRTLLRAGVGTGLGALGLGVAGSAGGVPGDEYAPLGRLGLAGTTEAVVGADGTTAYVAVSDGYATVDLSEPTRPTVLAERRDLLADRDNGPLRQVRDVSVDGDRLLAVAPANPAGDALAGALLVDVSDPAAPRRVAFHETAFPIHNCLLRDGVAYLTGNHVEGNPLVVLAAGDGLRELSRWSPLDHDDAWGDVPAGLRPLHDLHVRDGTAYLAYWDAGTWLLDVSDPADPASVARIGDRGPDELASLSGAALDREPTVPPGNAHYVDVNDDATLLGVGRESWAVEADGGLVGGPSGIDLYDLTGPDDPVRDATIEPPPSPAPTLSGVWTTAHNFDFAGDTLYTAWYQGGVKRHDVADPSAPTEETWWRRPTEARFWTAQAGVRGEFFVAADMGLGGGAGLYVFPDRPGEQADVPDPALTPPAPPSPTTAPESRSTQSRESASAPRSTPTATGRESPGFGVAAALSALGAGAWRALRR